MESTSCKMGPTVAVISSTYGNRMFVPMLSTTATPMVTRNSTGSSHESDMTSKMITASVSARTTTQSGSSVAGTSLFSYAIV